MLLLQQKVKLKAPPPYHGPVTTAGDEREPYYVDLDDGSGADRSVRLERVHIGQALGAYRRSWVIVEIDEEQRTARAEPAT